MMEVEVSLGRTTSDKESDETDTDEASIIFEIPPELQLRETLSQHLNGGSSNEHSRGSVVTVA